MDAQTKDTILRLMQTGSLELEGVLPWSSNYSFLARVCGELGEVPAVYKPRQGERPLWDFTQGTLCQRERAAFLLSELLEWDLVPPTVLREGEHGLGSVQLFIDHDPERHYFTFEGDPAFRQQLQRMVLFDVISNNADRKAGHVLIGTPDEALGESAERLWGIDHGICFHTEYKLRTVIWEFAGEPISAEMLADLARLQQALDDPTNQDAAQLADLLSPQEIDALKQRLGRVLESTHFVQPGPGRHYPWPPV